MNASTTDIIRALNDLRSHRDAALRAVSLASQDGTMADWLTARAVARPLCEAVTAVENRIRAAGFYGDTAVEMAVLGRLGRRHTDFRSVTYSELR